MPDFLLLKQKVETFKTDEVYRAIKQCVWIIFLIKRQAFMFISSYHRTHVILSCSDLVIWGPLALLFTLSLTGNVGVGSGRKVLFFMK